MIHPRVPSETLNNLPRTLFDLFCKSFEGHGEVRRGQVFALTNQNSHLR